MFSLFVCFVALLLSLWLPVLQNKPIEAIVDYFIGSQANIIQHDLNLNLNLCLAVYKYSCL